MKDAFAYKKLLLNKYETKAPWLAPMRDKVTVVSEQQGNDCDDSQSLVCSA